MTLLPKHLAETQATGLKAREPIAQYELGSQRNFIYLVLDWQEKKAAIVDPQADLERPLSELSQNGFELTAILLTHIHPDHTAGVPILLDRFPSLPVYAHPPFEKLFHSKRFAEHTQSFHPTSDRETIRVGSIELRVIHTPGHSAGGSCYFFERERPFLLTGDTLFIRDCGRTDFEDGSNEQMYASLQRIKSLPVETIILPGHHYAKECASVLSEELSQSAPLRCNSVGELASLP